MRLFLSSLAAIFAAQLPTAAWADEAPPPPPPAYPSPYAQPSSGPPAGPPSGPPAGPYAGPPAGPYAGPPAGPPQAPPVYGPPPAAPAQPRDARPWVIEPWHPSDEPPDGYVVRTSVNGGLIGGGAGLLGGFWLASVVVGIVGSQNEEEDGIDGDGIDPKDWAPMYAPVVGPFITMVNIEADGTATGLLVVNGILQAGGLAMIIGGALDTSTRAVRLEGIVPSVGPQQAGVVARGRF